jgi:hypothetical protein
MEFHVIYEANLDFEATRENLIQQGYNLVPSSVEGNLKAEAVLLAFNLLPNVRVNISPKGKFHAIQVRWESVQQMMEHDLKLIDLLKFKDVKIFRQRLAIIDLSIPV